MGPREALGVFCDSLTVDSPPSLRHFIAQSVLPPVAVLGCGFSVFPCLYLCEDLFLYDWLMVVRYLVVVACGMSYMFMYMFGVTSTSRVVHAADTTGLRRHAT